MSVLKEIEIIKFIDMCNDSWHKGWNESSGGNASHILLDETVENIKHKFEVNEWQQLGFSVENLANKFVIITGSGQCFRNVKRYPEESIAIIEISDSGLEFRKVWGLVNGGKTTMETPTHLLVHNTKIEIGNRTILHSHSPNINALTFVLDLDKDTFTREIWEMITECVVMFPKGIDVIPWMVCGSLEIGEKTHAAMEDSDIVVWPHHGTFCSGKDCDNAFGLMETVEKAADILIKVMSMGGKKHAITIENLDAVTNAFGMNRYQLEGK